MANPQHPILKKHLDNTIHLKAKESYEIYKDQNIAEQMGRNPVSKGRYFNLFYRHHTRELEGLYSLASLLKKGMIPGYAMANAVEDALLNGNVRQKKWARKYLTNVLSEGEA